MSTVISLISIRKRTDPKIEPWGTPALMDFRADAAPGGTTLCLRSPNVYWQTIYPITFCICMLT